MRRTLLVVGLAVLASTLFAPHQDHWNALDGVRWKSHREAYYTEESRDVFDRSTYRNAFVTMDVVGHGSFGFPREMMPDQMRDALRKIFPGEFPSDQKILFNYDGLLAATGKPPEHPEEILNDSVTLCHPPEDFYYQPDWVDAWKWYPAFWPSKSLLLTPFIAQTLFLATLAAVLVNLRQKKSR